MAVAWTGVAPAETTSQAEGVQETIESLVIAFILAFVFRGFLVEAFVIPTGSMAPALYGKHGAQICPDCGWEYVYGLPDGSPERDKIKCPNCGRESAEHRELPYHKAECSLLRPRAGRGSSGYGESAEQRLAGLNFEARSGDRILVFKWPFDIGGKVLSPHAWDVVVFKNPLNGEDNYIKRLIGLPNEVLEIIDGDIYTCPANELDAETVGLLRQAIELKHRQVGSKYADRRFNAELRSLNQRILPALDPRLRIRRKTIVAQKALWSAVFHQDHLPPAGVLDRRPHWVTVDPESQGGRWDTSTRRVRFAGLDSPHQEIRFSGKDITDFYAYNFGQPSSDRDDRVGDLRLKFVLEYGSGDGTLGLSLSKREDVFTAELSPDGRIVLKHRAMDSSGPEVTIRAAKIAPWKPGEQLEVEFANVDYRVYVRINGEEEPVLQTEDRDYAPNIGELRRKPPAAHAQPSQACIIADHLNLTLVHLALDRDVFYKKSDPQSELHPGWGTTGNPILLREDEFFVLGDNSPASQDSRLWDWPGEYLIERGLAYQVGTVPRDQLIGKAFFVYWPSGYRIDWLPVVKDFGVIPSVGKMRWIR